MECSIVNSGISADALRRYIEEQIFSLPGTEQPREKFSILLTGSRATGTYSAQSDVDIEVLCPWLIYESVQRELLAAGRTKSIDTSFYVLGDDNWERYFGKQYSRPHFSITTIEEVAQQLQEYDDINIWIWTTAKIIHDPQNQFREVLKTFTGYPRDVSIRKIKYHWMLTIYWGIEQFPHNHSDDNEILPAATAVLNAVNELYKFFFLVEGKPFPYTEKLSRFVCSTELGRQFIGFLSGITDLVTGRKWKKRTVWNRLDEAHRLLFDSDSSPDCRCLEKACAGAMLGAGVENVWVEADFDNINELLSGKLGPMP